MVPAGVPRIRDIGTVHGKTRLVSGLPSGASDSLPMATGHTLTRGPYQCGKTR